jgi:hypothetical protein
MLDVHPPHSPTHTWRDFFIHIATIVVGLLIAVGIEQAVEAIHHHHQREELIATFAASGIVTSSSPIATSQVCKVIERGVRTGWTPSASPRWIPVSQQSCSPQDPAPTNTKALPAPSCIAKSNGTAALLPETLAEMYEISHPSSAPNSPPLLPIPLATSMPLYDGQPS